MSVRLDAQTRARLSAWAQFLVPFGVLALAHRDRPASVLAQICLGFLIAEFAALTLHELGHAAAAALLRMRVFLVMIGSGRVLWSRQVGQVQVQVSALPLFGAVVAAPVGQRLTRLRMLLYAAAGPLANVLTAAWLWPHAMRVGEGLVGTTLAFWAWLSGFSALFNLIPLRLATPLGALDSDGLRILRSPWLTDAALEELWVLPQLWRASAVHRSQGPQASLPIYDEVLRRFPSSLLARHDRVVPLVGLGRFGEARDELRLLLCRSDLQPRLALFAKNNLAWSLAALRDPATSEEAELASGQALLLAPAVPVFNGTRAAVLVWLGRAAEARGPLEHALKGAQLPAARGPLLLIRAELGARTGDLAAARRDLEAGRRLAPDSPWLRWAETALDGAGSAGPAVAQTAPA